MGFPPLSEVQDLCLKGCKDTFIALKKSIKEHFIVNSRSSTAVYVLTIIYIIFIYCFNVGISLDSPQEHTIKH